MTLYFSFRIFLVFFVSAFLWLFFTPSVEAVDPRPNIRDEEYAAKYIDQSMPDPVVLAPGETKTVVIRFKNVGTKPWTRGGNHVSAYTEVPRGRKSVFKTIDWVSSEQTVLIQPSIVSPGEIGTLSIAFKAPTKPGVYTEEFYLAVENTTWMRGGYFFLRILVEEKKKIVLGEASVDNGNLKLDVEDGTKVWQDNVHSESVEIWRARKALLSKKTVTAKGGEQMRLVIGFQNIGERAWERYALVANRPGLSTAAFGAETLTFADHSWQSHSVIVDKVQFVPPNGVVREMINFRAPRERGVHTFSISPMVNGVALAASAEVEVTVTEDAPDHYREPSFDQVIETQPVTPRLVAEPRIRVGVAKNPVEFGQSFRFRPLEDNFLVYEGEAQRGVLPQKVMGAITAQTDGIYHFKGGSLDFVTKEVIRFVPETNPHATFLTLNYSRRVDWRGATDFNVYRGALEYRKTGDGNDNYYFINDLLFEDYVAGIAEAANLAPIEFLKAQAVSARTYAYFIQQFSDKHDERFFDVVATTGDQLYLGYHNETITPNYVAAAVATRGVMVTFNHEVAITPYFGHSNGQTKGWHQVWGGPVKPWLVPVVANYDAGRTRYGHGVGMSQRDAAIRAEKEGLTWEELLKHYYTGVEIEKFFL